MSGKEERQERLAADRERRRMEHRVLATDLPSGYSHATPFEMFPPLVCLRCGALIADYEVHDRWHVR